MEVTEAPVRPLYPKAFSSEHGIAATFGRRMGMEQDVHQKFKKYWKDCGLTVKSRLRGKYRQ